MFSLHGRFKGLQPSVSESGGGGAESNKLPHDDGAEEAAADARHTAGQMPAQAAERERLGESGSEGGGNDEALAALQMSGFDQLEEQLRGWFEKRDESVARGLLRQFIVSVDAYREMIARAAGEGGVVDRNKAIQTDDNAAGNSSMQRLVEIAQNKLREFEDEANTIPPYCDEPLKLSEP